MGRGEIVVEVVVPLDRTVVVVTAELGSVVVVVVTTVDGGAYFGPSL